MFSKQLKALLLLILLGMPVLFYLFLQSFGENKYEVPVFFENGIPDRVSGCETDEPHSLTNYFQSDACDTWSCSQVVGKYTVFCFIKSECETEAISQFARVNNLFRDQSTFHAVAVALDSVTDQQALTNQLELYKIPKNLWSWWTYQQGTETLVRCGFNLNIDCNASQTMVLIDKDYRIRGIYNSQDEEEMDRLVTEYQILQAEI